MYCIHCGKEIPENALFCPACGARQDAEGAAAPASPAPASPTPAAEPTPAPDPAGYAQPVNTSPIRKARYNLMCILGLVIGAVSLFFNYFGLVGLGALIVSVIGLVLCNRRRENGRILAVLGILCGAVSVITALLAMM